VRILLIRHGERAHQTKNESADPLSAEGRCQMCDLARMLELRNLSPGLYLSSTHQHAKDSAAILRDHLGSCPMQEVKALTSPSRPLTRILEELLEETDQNAVNLRDRDLVALVGHEPGLGRLLTRLTSTRGRPMARGEALCLEAPSWQHFLEGRGEVKFRCPVTNYQENEFRDKLVSKMQVSTLLAGFSFTALIELVKEGTKLGIFEVASVTLLAASLGFFVTSLYVYDRLSMPAGFWLVGPRLKHKKSRGSFEERLHEHGPVHTYMVWTWKWMFTPGVYCALAGFLCILLRIPNRLAVELASLAAILVTVLWYLNRRPALGAD